MPWLTFTAYRRTASRACSSSTSSSRSPDASGGRLFDATANAVAATYPLAVIPARAAAAATTASSSRSYRARTDTVRAGNR